MPNHTVPDTDGRQYVNLVVSVDEELYYLLYEHGEEYRLLLYSTGDLERDELTIEITGRPVCSTQVERVHRALDSGERLANFGILNDDVMTKLQNLRRQTRRFPEAVFDHNYDAQAHTKRERRTGELTGNVGAIADELVSDLKTESEYLSQKYGHRAVDHGGEPFTEVCASCGRELFLKHAFDGRDTRRTIGLCPRCGVVFDVPNSDGNPTGRPIVHSDEMVDESEDVVISIEFTNPTERTAVTRVVPTIRRRGHTNKSGVSMFTPEDRRIQVSPGKTVDAEFEFHAGSVHNNQYIIIGYVLSDLELYMGFSTTFVGEKTGFYGPRHDNRWSSERRGCASPRGATIRGTLRVRHSTPTSHSDVSSPPSPAPPEPY